MITNVITSDWNWWLFASLLVIVSLCAVGATHLPAPTIAPEHPAEPGPSTLPPASAVFAGRRPELASLTSRPNRAAHRAALFLITGEPGVGKTELATQAAYRLADRFPDAQLFLAFRSHGGRSGRADTRDVLLDALGTFAPEISRTVLDIDRLVAAWRAATTGRRMLLVLDDVVTADQVLNLLPGSWECLVISTARELITGLDPDLHLRLDGLLVEDAEHMIGEIVRRASYRLPGDDIRELAMVHRLPLTIRHAVDQLVNGTGPPATRTTPPVAGAGVFTTSFGRLGPRERLVLRRAALHPGPHLIAVFVASLAGLPAAETEDALAELHRLGLLHRPDPHGFGFHDLVRALALADAGVVGEDEQALTRLFRTTSDVIDELGVQGRAPVITSAARDHHPAVLPPMSEIEALTWTSVYFDDLHAVIRLAIDRHWDGTWQLVSGISAYMRFHRNIPQAEELNRSALQLAIIANDRRGQAACHLWLDRMARTLSEYPRADAHARRALAMFVALGDVLGQANAHADLANIEHHRGRYQDAAVRAEQARALFLQAGDTRGHADSEGVLGMLCRLTGDYRGALEHLDAALTLFTRIGNERNQGWIHIELGIVARQTGAYTQARHHFHRARDISERTDDATKRAWADRELGILARTIGDWDDALTLLSAALRVFTDLGGRRNIADALVELGTLHRVKGETTAARTSLERAWTIYHNIENRRGIAWTELELGSLDRLTGSTTSAREHIDRALAHYAIVGDRSGIARAHYELGCLAHLRNDDAVARTQWETALTLYTAMGFPEANETRTRLSTL
ncbi:tetratricopeptide repeat protein [Embleya sp. NPDC020886]|uniref:tetratricopeptide repeat protein n=1 Tax=Embleya sp. NPDC020886 TaxID=3363980 RepID=UPI0037BD3C6B